jgi:transposase
LLCGCYAVARRRFPSATHRASWAGGCPGNTQRAGKRLGGKRLGGKRLGGKRLGGKTRHGDTCLRALLGAVTWSLAHTASSYLAAHYHRFARRMGKHNAVVAVSHSLLIIIYHLLRTQCFVLNASYSMLRTQCFVLNASYSMLRTHRAYDDLGPDYFDSLEQARLQRHSVRRLEQLGFAVTLTSPQTA